MTEKSDKKRDPPISYRPPAELRAEFLDRVSESGLPTNQYITRCIFDGHPPQQKRGSAVDRKLLAKLLAECAQIRDGLDRLEVIASGNPDVSHAVEGAARHLEEIAAAVMQATGKKP